jgi:hypothetical protein
VQLSDQVFGRDFQQTYDLSPHEIKNLMSSSEWNTIYEMSCDQDLLKVNQ